MSLFGDIEFEVEEEWFDEEGEEDEFNETVLLQDPEEEGEEQESGAFLEKDPYAEEELESGAFLEEEEEEEIEMDPNLWHKRRLEATTHDELQDMEQTRANLLFHGEQYDVLPYLRCFNCAKIIGDKWEPFLEYVKEKRWKPKQIVKALPLVDEDQRSALLSALNDPMEFQDLLAEYDAEQNYEELRAQRKYTNKQIFDELKLKPCCRQLFISPIHIPIQQSAFKEPQKTTEIPNPLMNVDALQLQVSLSGPEEGPSELFEREEIVPLIPEIELPPVEMQLQLQCNVKAPLKIISAAQLGTIKEVRSDADLQEQFEIEELPSLEAPTKKRKDLIPVGKQLSVPQKPRIYRAR